MLVLASPTVAYALLVTDWSGLHALARSATVVGLVLLTLLVMGLVRWRYTRQVDGLVLLFDGRGWFSESGDPARLISVHIAAQLLAARVEVAGRRYRLLLCSTQYSREGWRRLRLALGQGLAAGGG